ncbi:hypothetical protein [Enterobacter mori]|uniref:hypothetical protein n=1 Tax=Enterobacter mori TaxID=539813 RepID=UPI002236A232|nr:hypothetical protein [Enterobacter mori]MCW4989974.1 hypothetical protein [Enterobacter mori]
MSNIDFDELSKDCAKYKTKKLVKVLPLFKEDGALRDFINYETQNFKNFQLYNHSKRKDRDSFYNTLIKNIECDKTVEHLSKILSVFKVSEIYIDQIKEGLKDVPLMKENIQILCSAVIKNALEEGHHLQDLMESHINRVGEDGALFSLNDKNILDDEGNSISPDSVLDKIVNFLTLTLKMFSHEHKLTKSVDIIIPDIVQVERSLVNNASAIFYYSLLWNDLITCTKSCIYFDNEIDVAESSKIPEHIQNEGIRTAVLYDRTRDDFEYYDSISNQRLSRRLSQNFWEAISSLNLSKRVASDITKWTGSLDDHAITLEEYPFLVSLMEAISSHDSNANVLGLSLREWVRGYAVISYLSKTARFKYIYRKEEITSVLRLAGFTEQNASTFIKNITFGSDSRDVYDSPLIKTDNSSFFLFTPAYTAPLISNIVLSKFSSKQADLSEKGYGFEKDILKKLEEYNLHSNHFSFKRGLEQYEYDAIFLLDDKAFILECKNTTLSGGSLTRAFQKKKFILKTTNQVKRLVNGLRANPEVFEEHFGKSINDYELVPVIMNNLPFSIPGKVNDVYVTDFSSFSRLIKSRYINLGVISHSDKDGYNVSNHKKVYSMWEGDTLTAKDIINHFENPIQLHDFIENKEIKKYPLRTSVDKIFFNVVCETGYDSMSKKHREIFKSLNPDLPFDIATEVEIF